MNNLIKPLSLMLFLGSALLPMEAGRKDSKKTSGLSVPVTHVMTCCRETTDGTRFLVNGEFIADHDYGDIDQCRDILQKIKDAGINVISVDCTNPPQWDIPVKDSDGQDCNLAPDYFLPKLDNIAQVCAEKDMEFFIFLGNTRAWTMKYWNEVAKKVWNKYASQPNYRRYGFGDDRPMLLIFLPGRDFEKQWAETPDSEKDYLAKFHIGTSEVNERILPTRTDGWGYRNFSQSSDGKVRFCAPNGGIGPESWMRIDAKEWAERVDWAGDAEHYTVFGSWDDTCDGIFWGIADCSQSNRGYHYHDATASDPYVYYNVVKNYLSSRKPKKSGQKK